MYGLSVVLILTLVFEALAQTDQPRGSKFLATIYEPWLRDLPFHPHDFNPALGGQNWTTCCALAINETVSITNGTLYIRPNQSFFRGNLSLLERFPQYPCTATFNGSSEHPDQLFWTPYTWCAERCPGWAVTSANDFDNWVKPLISFILPSLVFALNVPRRRKIGLPKNFFSVEALSFGRLVWFGLKVPLAVLIIILDLLLWLSIIFSVAGPVIMSGMYEAILDANILDYVGSRIKNNTLSLQQRTHALLVVLLGNLDFDPAWNHSVGFVQELSPHSPRQKLAIMSRRRSSASVAVDNDHLRPLVHPQAPSTLGDSGISVLPMKIDLGTLYTPEEQSKVKAVKIKLDAMLDSQTKFGSAVGAPILFYIGAFIYSVFDVKSDLGNYLTAHQLAFGMFWMTIPHIAIVSSLLLAGNNPSIWQTAWQDSDETSHNDTNGTQSSSDDTADKKPRGWLVSTKRLLVRIQAPLLHPLQQSYNPTHSGALYRSAWVWNRGVNKAMWIAQLAEEYQFERIQTEVLKGRFDSYLWVCAVSTCVLIFLPAFLGGLVSYNTPQVGLGCRSLLMLTYGLSQILLICLVVLDWCFWKRDQDGKVRPVSDSDNKSRWRWAFESCWFLWFCIGFLFGVFTSIGGTLFILIGLFRNCLCIIPATHWLDRSKAEIFWDGATGQQIYYAKRYWLPAGVVGAAFLVFVSCVGWWYQRSLLSRFHKMVSEIDSVKEYDLQEGGEATETPAAHLLGVGGTN